MGLLPRTTEKDPSFIPAAVTYQPSFLPMPSSPVLLNPLVLLLGGHYILP